MLEQLYTDFTEKLLPKVQEGLMITQDYFIDLFGRYVKYLIIVDSILFALLLSATVLIVIFIVWLIKHKELDTESKAFTVLIVGAVALLFFAISVEYLFNLVLAITVPEVRVYQELNSFLQ